MGKIKRSGGMTGGAPGELPPGARGGGGGKRRKSGFDSERRSFPPSATAGEIFSSSPTTAAVAGFCSGPKLVFFSSYFSALQFFI